MRQRKKGRLAPSLGLRRPLHESYELFLPLTGALGFEVAGYPYTVKRGSVLILPPNVVHRLLVKESEPLEYLYVQFDPRVIPNDTDRLFLVSHCPNMSNTCDTGISLRENSHALRLASELADLLAAKPNPCVLRTPCRSDE